MQGQEVLQISNFISRFVLYLLKSFLTILKVQKNIWTFFMFRFEY